MYFYLLQIILTKSQNFREISESESCLDHMEFKSGVDPIKMSKLYSKNPSFNLKCNNSSNIKPAHRKNNLREVIASAVKKKKYRLFGGSFPGPTIIYPPIGPIVDLVSASGDKMTTDIHTVIASQLLVINTAITNYSTNTSVKVTETISKGVANLKYDIGDSFNQVYTALATDINTIINTASTSSQTNISTANAQLLTDLQATFATASNATEAAVASMGTTIITGVDQLITSSGTDLYNQIESILADTTNTSPIMPQLKFLDPSSIQNSITTEATNLSNTINNLMHSAQRSMDILISNSVAGQVTSETTALSSIEIDVKAAITIRVNQLLADLQTKITIDTAQMRTDVDALINKNIATLTTAVNTSLTVINTGIEKTVTTTSAQTIKDVQAAIIADGNFMKDQLRIIFATT
ncbi:hypothetical protein EDEG_01028 [Edhazardia aedis USNM 41457]|uniref:Uncharacterized protein n=1 Tax=Edhazardia aedis (strain USNM 41457) TaxID=1003232 RepID=J8ZYJ6_EDHAE|nr:hypothetical protein EDEG_01028 [Edhazardia aedis USNM 41457]|eukprot:EJW04738.1 hypothetical protein EDEG_01028 [Edhazardia aedis USNM 41457]